MLKKTREIHLKKRPQGVPKADDFSLIEKDLPALTSGQVLVRNLWMSVDPYMRGRMMERKSYVPPYQLNRAMEGGAVGQIIASRHPDFPEGACVTSMKGWRTAFIDDGTNLQLLPATKAPLQAFLGVLGMPGMAAWVGLEKIARLKSGDHVFVSAASGAVGSLVCQIAKLRGCSVAGSAGSEEKIKYLKNVLGVDATVNYRKTDDLQKAMAEASPQGIDVYFENVGGPHLEAALNLMNDYGRLAVCGMIDQYNASSPVPGPVNLGNIIIKRLTMQGFIVFDHWDEYPAFVETMGTWIEEGKIKNRETVYHGLENSVEAFLGLFEGKNLGKMLVNLEQN